MYFVPLFSGAWAPHSVSHHTGDMERGWHFRFAASEQCTDARPLPLDGDDSIAASTVTDRSLQQCEKAQRKGLFAQSRTAHTANEESPSQDPHAECETTTAQLSLAQPAAQVSGHVWRLSRTNAGCREVQRLLETLPGVDRIALAAELHGHVLDAVQSPNANYVMQKCIEVLPVDSVSFIIEELQGRAAGVARHRFGCRIVQRLLEHCPSAQLSSLVSEVLSEAQTLVRHKFGNFVMQCIIEHGCPDHRRRVVDVLAHDGSACARHRFASLVILRALTHCTSDDRRRLVLSISTSPQELKSLARTQCGSFVVREMQSKC